MTERRIPDLSAAASPPRRALEYTSLTTDTDPIGAGGQAVVYEVTLSDDPPPDRVALKEPATQGTLTTEAIEAFLDEAETWETVDQRERRKPRWADSEHIVGIIDTGEELPWIAMEYMDGGSLADRLEANPGGLPVDEAVWIGERVCRGVELAHSYGIAHLDLKPANVLFRQTAGDTWDVPKIADWGLARQLAEQTGTMEGLTIEYAAPEQFESDEFGDPDTLTDIYQLGALVHALVTGEPPYTGSQASVMYDVVDGDTTPAPGRIRSECPEALDVAVRTALRRSKSDRYRNVAAFEQALRAIRTGRSLPPTIAQRIEDASSHSSAATDHADLSESDTDEPRSESQQPAPGRRDDSTDTADEPAATDALVDLDGVEEAEASRLRSAGFESIDALRAANQDEIAELPGISDALAARIKAAVAARTPDASGERTERDGARSAEPAIDAGAGDSDGPTVHVANAVRDEADVERITDAVANGDIVVGPDLKEGVASIDRESLVDAVNLAARDLVQWGEVLVATPDGFDISRQQPFGDGDVHIAGLSDMSDAIEVGDAVERGDICLCYLPVETSDQAREHIADRLKRLSGDIVEWNDIYIATPPGLDISREPLVGTTSE